jgi:hypothetical protein
MAEGKRQRDKRETEGGGRRDKNMYRYVIVVLDAGWEVWYGRGGSLKSEEGERDGTPLQPTVVRPRKGFGVKSPTLRAETTATGPALRRNAATTPDGRSAYTVRGYNSGTARAGGYAKRYFLRNEPNEWKWKMRLVVLVREVVGKTKIRKIGWVRSP